MDERSAENLDLGWKAFDAFRNHIRRRADRFRAPQNLRLLAKIYGLSKETSRDLALLTSSLRTAASLRTGIHDAIRQNDEDSFLGYLLVGPKLAGGVALHIATVCNNRKFVRYILDAGIDVDAPCWANGMTALHYAAEKGHLDILRDLLAAGADPNIGSKFFSETPLSCVIDRRYRDIGRGLLGARADMETATRDEQILHNLLEAGALLT